MPIAPRTVPVDDEPSTDGTEPESPAPVLKLAAAAGAPATGPATTAPLAAEREDSGTGTVLGVIGIALGLAALVLGLLAYRRSGRPAAGSPAAEPETVAAGRNSPDVTVR